MRRDEETPLPLPSEPTSPSLPCSAEPPTTPHHSPPLPVWGRRHPTICAATSAQISLLDKNNSSINGRSTSTWQDSAVHPHLMDKGLLMFTFWTEKTDGLKASERVCSLWTAIFQQRGGLKHQLSATYNDILRSLPRRLNLHSHLQVTLIGHMIWWGKVL